MKKLILLLTILFSIFYSSWAYADIITPWIDINIGKYYFESYNPFIIIEIILLIIILICIILLIKKRNLKWKK